MDAITGFLLAMVITTVLWQVGAWLQNRYLPAPTLEELEEQNYWAKYWEGRNDLPPY